MFTNFQINHHPTLKPKVEEIRRRMDVIVENVYADMEVPPPIESFEDMNLDAKIMLDIKFHEYEKPTPIQAQVRISHLPHSTD